MPMSIYFNWVRHGFAPYALHFQAERVANLNCKDSFIMANPLDPNILPTFAYIMPSQTS